PADPSWKVAIYKAKRAALAGPARCQSKSGAHGREVAGSGFGLNDGVPQRHGQHQAINAKFKLMHPLRSQSPGAGARASSTELREHLERRNLCKVENVLDADVLPVEHEPGVVIDAEVAHRMRQGTHRREQQNDKPENECCLEDLHARPLPNGFGRLYGCSGGIGWVKIRHPKISLRTELQVEKMRAK